MISGYGSPKVPLRNRNPATLGSGLQSGAGCPTVFAMAGMYSMNDLLNLLAQEGGEEVRLEPGEPPLMVLQGRPKVVDGALVTADYVAELFRGVATEEQKRELDRCGDIHFTFVARGSGRFSLLAAMRGENLSLRIKNLGR
jgi:Tfp pilus assembly ATPase PilU